MADEDMFDMEGHAFDDDMGAAEDWLLGHQYLEFPLGSEAQRRCAKLRTMTVGGHVAIDWAFLEEVTEAARARDIIGVDTPWSRLFQIAAEDTFRPLTVEFLSSFTYQRRPVGHVDDPDHPWVDISFRMAGQQFEMSLDQFAVHSGLYRQEEIGTQMYAEGVTELDRQTLVSFWRVIARGPFGRSMAKASAIIDPLYCYLHRIIASSIVPRHFSREKVNRSDLFFLYCLLMRRSCALHECLAEYFATAHHRQARGALYGGCYVTVIARSLGLVPDEDPLLAPAIPSSTLAHANVRSMRLTRMFPGIGLRFRTRDHDIFVPEPLPAADEIPVLLEAQPGVPAEQEQPQPAVDVEPPPPPPPPPQPQQQHPQHVYEDLPPAARVVVRDFDRRLRRQERHSAWIIQTMQDVRQALGLPELPLPHSPPQPDDDQ